MACMNQSASSYGLASWMHPQQGGLPAKKQKSCPYRSKYWGSFSMCILLTVLKHERQQCQYKHTENHKILECKIYHRHHLHSIKEMEGNATLQWFVSIQSATPLGTLSHGAHIPISSVLRTCFLDAPATQLSKSFYHINIFLATLCNLRYKTA